MSQIPGARGLFYLKLVDLIWYAAYSLAMPSLWRYTGDFHTIENWLLACNVVWLAIIGVEAALTWQFARGRQGTPVEGLARVALICCLVLFALDLLNVVPGLSRHAGGMGSALYVARIALGVTGEICLWLAVVRSLTTDPGLNTAFFGVVLAGGALSLAFVVVPLSVTRPMSEVVSWLRMGTNAVSSLLMLVVLWRLANTDASQPGVLSAPGAVPGAAPLDGAALPARAGGRDIAYGLAWLVGGGLVTVISYSAASSAGGGRYFVTTGAIAYGLVRLVRGLVGISSSDPRR